MPLVQTRGAASAQGFGEFAQASAVPNYIEDVFSTYLYTGTGATRTITNNIDESGKGALTWIKSRTSVQSHILNDTVRGAGNNLLSDSTSASLSINDTLTAFGTTGFTLGADSNAVVNGSGQNYVSWTLREQPKFFDIVTWTGNGTNRTISHNLGSVPACILVKSTSGGYAWAVYHSSLANTEYLVLNSTAAKATDATYWNSTTPTSTEFSIGTAIPVNNSGANYVAYVFASNAGGFGLTGTDNVISCGTYTTDGSGVATVSLGYEPQWVLTKATSGIYGTTDWVIADNMRGMPAPPTTDKVGGLFPNTAGAEDNNYNRSVHPTSTGFVAYQYASTPYIYIAIRRGPMKVPTVGTSVFSPISPNNAVNTKNTTGFPIDLQLGKYRAIDSNILAVDRLRGASTDSTSSGQQLRTNTTNAEDSGTWTRGWDNTGFLTPVAYASTPVILWNFGRAPSVFDEVCYTGTGTGGQTFSHNLGVTPELMIIKSRSASGNWPVYSTATGNTKVIYLNYDTYASASNEWNNTTPTASVFTLGINSSVNNSGTTYVAYLFATCAGVSKVGSYTGTGATQTINCGFTSGVRFVMIKRYDSGSTGDWYVWDSARGIIPANDPYLLLNSAAAEVTGTDYIDTTSVGFDVTSTAPAAINANGGTFIFLAIA